MRNDALLQAGLTDPVLDSLRVFRRALAAMSEPGTVSTLLEDCAIPSLTPSTSLLLLSLLDANTPLWLSPTLDHPAVRANLLFHCNCPIVARRQDAAFAVLAPEDAADLQEFNVGEARRPDLSCTLIIQLPDFHQGSAMRWSGAGILDERQVALPLPEEFWAARAQRNAFPLGLDIFFTAPQRLMGLPRTTRVIPASIHAAPGGASLETETDVSRQGFSEEQI